MAVSTTTHRTMSLDLPAVPASVPRVRSALLEAGLDPDLDHVASLLATELVSNGVRHAVSAESIGVQAQLSDGFVRVDVTDGGPGFDPAIRHGASGFGLRLVDKLATAWGVEGEPGATRVWFEVDRRRRRFGRES